MNRISPSAAAYTTFNRAEHSCEVQVARDLHDSVWSRWDGEGEPEGLDRALARFCELARERWQDRLARATAAGHTRAAERARRELYLLGM